MRLGIINRNGLPPGAPRGTLCYPWVTSERLAWHRPGRPAPAAPMPPYYVPEKFAKLFAFHGRSVQPYRDPNRSVTQKFGIPVGGPRPADDHHRGHATATGWPA